MSIYFSNFQFSILRRKIPKEQQKIEGIKKIASSINLITDISVNPSLAATNTIDNKPQKFINIEQAAINTTHPTTALNIKNPPCCIHL